MKLPPTWRLKRVREVGHVQAGRQRSPSFTKGTFRQYLRVANIYDGNIDTSDVLSMKFTDKEYEIYKLHQGDILLNEGQSRELVGRCAMYVGEPADCCFQNTLVRFQAGEDCEPEYAAHLFSYCYLSGVFSAIASQTTSIAHLGVSRFAELKLPFPPVEEQHKITAILDCQNIEIACAKKLLATKERRRQALAQRLLTGKARLPGFTKPWQTSKIQQILKPVRRPVLWDDSAEYKLLSLRRRSGGAFHRETMLGSEILTKKMNVARAGDFLISKMQVVHGAMAMVPPEFDGFHVSDSYLAYTVRSQEQLDMRFFDWLSRMPIMYHKTYISSYGVHIEKMTFNDKLFLGEMITLPPTVDEQRAIVEVLEDTDREIALHRAELDALKRQKRGLMQQLLTGKVRVP